MHIHTCMISLIHLRRTFVQLECLGAGIRLVVVIFIDEMIGSNKEEKGKRGGSVSLHHIPPATSTTSHPASTSTENNTRKKKIQEQGIIDKVLENKHTFSHNSHQAHFSGISGYLKIRPLICGHIGKWKLRVAYRFGG